MEAGTLGSIEVTTEFDIRITRKILKLVVLESTYHFPGVRWPYMMYNPNHQILK